jgi:hypothetical protein
MKKADRPATLATEDIGHIAARRLAAFRLWPISCGMKGEGDDRYSEEETARRADEVTRRMINMQPPKHRTAPTPKTKERPVSKGRVHKGKTRSY